MVEMEKQSTMEGSKSNAIEFNEEAHGKYDSSISNSLLMHSMSNALGGNNGGRTGGFTDTVEHHQPANKRGEGKSNQASTFVPKPH